METGFKLIENNNVLFLTYVLSGGVNCDGTDRVSVARAMDKVKSNINSQMVDYLWSLQYPEEVEEIEPSEDVIKILDNELNNIENEGIEI